ncbi:Flp pilus assembly protein CpaB [Desulfopila inferna]|uniref:Flp pilus assembly protein CpaB n=1 Tax=Desulfopila inferna TaxID=468528 RepID=UPI001962EB91|nr:Flp pilus assembly protein CpaB [Desulfopila inferna]MBM9603829.1 Flp pilus assembly protein CpaB [Desulfopila inferna]
MNKSARILFLIVALAAASLVSYIVYQKSSLEPATAETAKNQEIAQIAVAAGDLQRGAKITAQDLRLVSYLKASVPRGHFADLATAVGRVIIKPIGETEPILESALAPTDFTRGGMAAFITPQKRAMAIKVDEVIGVAGFLHPGHKVDVLVSLEEPGERRSQITKTVLENIVVLSVGTQAQESDDKKATRVTVVTLEVDLEEGEKLALAVNQGRIQLALRGYSDTDHILTKGITVPSLLKSFATASIEPVNVKKMAAAPSRPIRQHIIEVMNGNQVSRITMDGN